MKKKQLKLEDLKVKSFVTEVTDENGETVKGGTASWMYYTLRMSLFNANSCQPECRGGGDDGAISNIVVEIDGGPPACLLDPVVVEG